jgi:cytochrome oxidase Cu insertion factor (SCO1/SenC/PrrC family)
MRRWSSGAIKPGWMLLLLTVVFAAPMIGSWVLYFHTDIGRGAGAAGSHGRLIDPPVPLPDAALLDAATGVRSERLHGKWTLLSLAQRECDAACEKNLYRMRQLRLAVGKDTYRVQRLLVVYGESLNTLTPSLLDAYRGQLIVEGEEAGISTAAFRQSAGDEPVSANRLYLVDPLGNLILSYDPDVDPAGIISDLKRLLKYSRIG